MSGTPGTVSRYTAPARANHWVTAIALILLALSGMSLFHPSLFFLTDLFGGGASTRAIHPWIGVLLVASFAGGLIPGGPYASFPLVLTFLKAGAGPAQMEAGRKGSGRGRDASGSVCRGRCGPGECGS